MFGRINEQFEVFDCLLEIEVGGKVQTQRMKAPRIMIEQQFESLVQQAANNNTFPIKIKISREVSIWSKLKGKWIEQENSIVFTNIAYGNSKNH